MTRCSASNLLGKWTGRALILYRDPAALTPDLRQAYFNLALTREELAHSLAALPRASPDGEMGGDRAGVSRRGEAVGLQSASLARWRTEHRGCDATERLPATISPRMCPAPVRPSERHAPRAHHAHAGGHRAPPLRS